MKRFRSRLTVILGALSILFFFLGMMPSSTLIFSAPSAEGLVNGAWQRAEEVGIYDYQTDIIQTTWPTERLENVGLSSRQERVYLEGHTNRHQELMEMTLWAEGGSLSSGQGALEIKVEEGLALGRVGGQDWEEIEAGEMTNLFAPGGDLLGYLVAAKNVREMGEETRSGISFTRYNFELDGLAFAEYMREQMEEELRSQGELPASLNLDLVRYYVDMTGTGEIWIDTDGLPLREVLDIKFPAADGAMEWYEAQITTDFSNWGKVSGSTSFLFPALRGQGLAGVTDYVAREWSQPVMSVGLIAALMVLTLLLVLYRENRVLYRAFVMAVIVSMVFGPLMNSHQVYAFSQSQGVKATEAEYERAQQAEYAKQEAQDEANQFSPTVSPLAQAEAKRVLKENEQALLGKEHSPVKRAVTNTNSVDTDRDGLSDQHEQTLGTNPNQADTDGDGLNDGIEVSELGTNPKHIDTDGDLISDQQEVTGFKDGANRQWYLDPLALDTNGDGRIDSLECLNLTNVNPSNNTLVTASGTACEDTDADGTPDIIEYDDDNDGVPDVHDSSPTTVLAGAWQNNGYTGLLSDTLNFKLDSFQTNKPLLVDLQLRPTDPTHLWYSQNVLDWPSNDKEGQVRRVFSDTFGTSGRDANGDMRMIPMLEIEIPYQNGHYGNLPVKSGYNGGITATTPLTAWLDKRKMDSYALSVRKKDNSGNLLVYAPLTLLREKSGDTPVAFGTRLYYEPNSESFGLTHKMRLAWLVYAKTDACQPPAGQDHKTYCQNVNNWTKLETVIHTYYDQWYVTSLNAHEEHGVNVGIAFENQSYNGGSAHYDNYLWQLANGLQNSFLAGRTGSSGTRDLTINTIKQRFDKDSNNRASNTERWNIPQQALQVKTYSFSERGATASVPMTTTKQLLTTHFPSAGVGDAANLLFVREESSRNALLSVDAQGSSAQNGRMSGNSLTLSFASAQNETIAAMSWAPFQYKGAGVWESYAIPSYWTLMDQAFKSVFTSESDSLSQAGRILLAKSFYLSLYLGAHNLVQRGNTVLTSDSQATDAQIAQTNPNLGPNPDQVALSITTSLLNSLATNYINQIKKIDSYLSVETDTAKRAAELLIALGKIQVNATEQRGLDSFDEALSGLVEQIGTLNSGFNTGGPLMDVALLAVHDQVTGPADWMTYTFASGRILGGLSGLVFVAYNKIIADVVGSVVSSSARLQYLQDFSKSTAMWGLVIGVGIAVGMFLYQLSSIGWDAGSQAFTAALATFAASIIVALIMFAITLIPLIGPIIVAVIALIDGLILLICHLTGADQSDNTLISDYLCAGITGTLTKLVRYLLYDYNPLADLSVEGRMLPTNFTQTLLNTSQGMSKGNILRLGVDVKTGLYMGSPTGLGHTYWWQFNNSNLREATFKYKLASKEEDIHSNLSLNQTTWTPVNDGDKRGTVTQQVSLDLPFTTSGINVESDVYLAEGYVMNAQECFMLPISLVPPILIPVCYLRDEDGTMNLQLGDKFKYDVLPATLDEFYSLRQVGTYGQALAWDDRFPVLFDADGDGLRSKAKGGNDPNDRSADSDADGLSDFWEIQNGYDAYEPNKDGDGLNDYWERFYGTNPRQADTDRDGLLDNEEVFHQNLTTNVWEGGWEYVYAFDSNNNPLRTLVTSDPLKADTDGDGIVDKLEKVYGYHPRLPSELKVISLNSEVSNGNSNVTGTNLAKPGDTLTYIANIENHLRDRYALGLLETNFPASTDLSGPEAAKTYTLGPSQEITLTSQVAVANSISTSQQVTLTNRAGAEITDLRGDADGRRLWLHLNEQGNATSFSDNSLLGYHATCSGSSCPIVGQPGYANQALNFDAGSQDYLSVTNADKLGLTNSSFTVMAWIKGYNFSGERSVVGTDISQTNRGLHLVIRHGKPYMGFYANDLASNTTLSTNRWYHLTWRYDAGQQTQTIFIDGQKDATGTNRAAFQGSDMVHIGRWQSGNYFNGLIDEVEIYAQALTDQQIAQRFKEPIFYAKFDDYATDASLYNHAIDYPGDTARHPQIFNSNGALGGYAYFNRRNHFNVRPSDSLDLSQGDGHFSYSVWLRPSQNGTKWRTVIGNWQNENQAYPTLEVKDYKVRLFFGDGSSYCTFESINPVLGINQWTHVLVTFGPAILREAEDEAQAEASGDIFKLYINGQQIPGNQLNGASNCSGKKPYATKSFSIGRGTNRMDLTVHSLYVTDEDDGSGWAEVKLFRDEKYNQFVSGRELLWNRDVDNNDSNNPYTLNINRSIYDDNWHNLLLCENDGSWTPNECSGRDDVLIWSHQASFRNIDHLGYRDQWYGGNTGSEDGSGYLRWEVQNFNYERDMDELRIYRYALTADEAADLYNGTLRAMEMRFDEAPGHALFKDSSGNNIVGSCSGSSCPDSGIPGRSNQTLRFDGVDDYVTQVIDVSEDAYAASLWFKTDCTHCGILNVDNGPLGNSHDRDLYLYEGRICARVWNNETICTPSGTSYANNQWHHLVHTFGGAAGGQKLYLDGTQRASGNLSSSGLTWQTGLTIGYSQNANSPYFKGLIDDVVILKKGVTGSEVQALKNEVPLLNLHLDESANATTFTDSSNLANHATCSGTTCPKAGFKGQMREAIVFDGQNDYLTLAHTSNLGLQNASFTVAGWVNGKDLTGNRPILGIFEGNQNNGLHLQIREGKPFFGFFASEIASTTTLSENRWYHLVWRYDRTKAEQAIFINGTLDRAGAGSDFLNGTGTVYLGRDVSRYFAGTMDEVAIYGRALSNRDIKTLYDYEVAWFDTSIDHQITIDAEEPTVSLALDTTYIARKDIILAIHAADLTSNVEKVEVQIDGGAWQTATRDQNVWLFTYTPTVDGLHTINVRATDSVGHVSTSSKSVTVDGTAPTVELDSSFTSGSLKGSTNQKLFGTFFNTSGDSGVDTIYVELLDRTGESLSGPLLATINGSTWESNHSLTLPPTGSYTVRIQPTDKVQNTNTQTSILTFDGAAPVADITYTGAYTNSLSGIGSNLPVITGTVSDMPQPNKPLLHLHFEEAANATTFEDGSGNFLDGACAGSSCPTAGASGKYGKALTFNGSQHINLPKSDHFDFSGGQFTQAFWLYPTVTDNDYHGIIGYHTGNSATHPPSLWIKDQTKIHGGFGDGTTWHHYTSDSVLTSNQWNHVAAAFDGTTYRLYVNGSEVLTQTWPNKKPYPTKQLTIGKVDNNIQGQIDEVLLYNRALSKEDIYALANPTTSGVISAQINFRHAKDRALDQGMTFNMPFEEASGSTTLADISGNRHNGSCSGSSCPTTGEAGKLGSALNFDGSNDLVTLPTANQLGFTNSSFTAAAWIKGDTYSGRDRTILGTNDQVFNKGLFLTVRYGKPYIGFYQNDTEAYTTLQPNQWYHIVWRYDKTRKEQAIFINGTLDISQTGIPAFAGTGTVYIGRWGEGGHFDGLIDELRIYNQALSADEIKGLYNETWSAVTLANSNNTFSTWQYQLPAALEGPHNINLRTVDAKGNTRLLSKLWTGEIDTLAPRLTFMRTQVTSDNAQIKCVAEDDNLSESGWVCPGITIAQTQKINQNAAWYRRLFTQAKLARLETALQTVQGAGNSMTACDIFNNCATTTATVLRQAQYPGAAISQPLSVILTPTTQNVFTSTAPISITGHVASPAGVDSLEVTIDGGIIYEQTWPANTPEANWSTSWTPSSEGAYTLEATLTDGAGNVISDTAETIIYVDNTPPAITIITEQITNTNFNQQGYVTIAGRVTEDVALDRLQVKINDGVYQEVAAIGTQRWQGSFYFGTNLPPTGENVTITAQVSDIAGHTTQTTKSIFAEATLPEPITATLTYERPSPPAPLPQGEGSHEGVTQPITPGMTIDDVLQPTLTVKWSPSSDASGLGSYLVEWVDADTGDVLASEEVTEPREASFTASEALKLAVRVISRDIYGNAHTETLAPIYIDYAYTPVYTEVKPSEVDSSWHEWNEPYRGWTENSCSLIGTDYRVHDNNTKEVQNFYSSWDQNGLRLAWTGANWQTDGDLFIYFDTQAGGTERVYNPYPATQDNTIILLPTHQEVSREQRATLTTRQIREQAGTDQMAADYMLWVEEKPEVITQTVTISDTTITITDTQQITATLMAWDDSTTSWQAVAGEWFYHLDTDHEIPTTDIYLPFEVLGITDPSASTLEMLAFATEEEALRLWATMPAGNHVNSEQVVSTVDDGFQRFMLNKRYEWSALAENICPSGILTTSTQRQRTGQSVQFTGADVRATISADPVGIGYSVFGHHLTDAHSDFFDHLIDWVVIDDELCQLNPDDEECERDTTEESLSFLDYLSQEGLADMMDVEHPYLAHENPVTYQIHLTNRGAQPATGLKVYLFTWGRITLPDGEYLQDQFGEYYWLELDIGTLQAGEEQTISFEGVVDMFFDLNYDTRWATINGIVYDDSGHTYQNELEWLYMDHEIDSSPPDYLEISHPTNILSPNTNTIEGFVFDLSPVPTLTLEVKNAAGTINGTTCTNETPNTFLWACQVDIGAANEGDSVQIRAKATDIHQQESDWFDWQPFVVDNSVPTLTLSPASEANLSDGLIGFGESTLTGVLTDNRLISGVEVCLTDPSTSEQGSENCNAATIVLGSDATHQTVYTYDDEPEEALAIDAANSCESGTSLERTFTVTDTFTIADIDVGLNLAHNYRNDLKIDLFSPTGTQVTLIDANTKADNLDIQLNDASAIFASLDSHHHDIEAPYYDNQRAPYERLSHFNGESAQGTWKLTICDDYPDADDGSYHRSRLTLTANSLPQETQATWQYELPIGANQQDTQQLTFYGRDDAGNRSQGLPLTFKVDTTPPTIEATVPRAISILDPDLLISGQINDQNGIQAMHLHIKQPNGQLTANVIDFNDAQPTQLIRQPMTPPAPGAHQLYLPLIAQRSNQSSWYYTDANPFSQPGTYTLWIEAQDYADNRTQIGPYQLEVAIAQQLYLPLVQR